MVMPIIRLLEEQREVLKVFVSDVWFKSTLSDSHQAVDILQDLERFLPQSKFNCDLKLFQSDFNVSVIDICLFDVDVNCSLILVSVSLVQYCSQTFFQSFAEWLELMLSVVFFNKDKDFQKCFLENIFKFLINLDSFNDVFVTLPDNFKSVSKFFNFLFFGRLETWENDGWAGFFTFDVGQVSDHVDIFMKDIFLKNSLKLSVSVMLQHILQRFGILSLGEGSVRLEDIFDTGVLIVIESKFDEFILD